MSVSIYLKQHGDGFEIVKKSDSMGKELMLEPEATGIHPIFGQIVSANNREAVATVLKELKKIAESDLTKVTSYFFRNGQQVNNYGDFVIKGDTDTQDIKFSLWHNHAPYRGHWCDKGAAHRDTIDKMIEFVENPPPRESMSI